MNDQALLDEVLRMAKNLGPEFEEAIVNTLTNHHPTLCRGKAMTVAEANNLKVGDVVWMRYQKSPGETFRIDEAVELHEIYGPGNLGFNCGDFVYYPDDEDPADDVVEWDFGESRLYHVKERKPKKTKAAK